MTQVFPLSEGTFTVGRDKVFRPFDPKSEELNDRAIGSLLVEVQPFVIVNDKDVILCDMGLGINNPDGEIHLPINLAQHNIHPEDVTKILMTHLHKDHAGGLDPQLFPNAIIYIYKKEFDFAFQQGFPSYYPDELAPLKDNERVHWLTEPEGVIDDYISYKHTGGHSPEHIVFWIKKEDGTEVFFGGDEAPQYKQMLVKYKAKYDFNGELAMEYRSEWKNEGEKEKWQFLFYHDVNNPMTIF